MKCKLHTLGSAKKSSSKHINMGSSFEDLDVTSPFLKTDLDFETRFARYCIFLIFELEKKKRISQPHTPYQTS